jgi:hypothetical protein
VAWRPTLPTPRFHIFEIALTGSILLLATQRGAL